MKVALDKGIFWVRVLYFWVRVALDKGICWVGVLLGEGIFWVRGYLLGEGIAG